MSGLIFAGTVISSLYLLLQAKRSQRADRRSTDAKPKSDAKPDAAPVQDATAAASS